MGGAGSMKKYYKISTGIGRAKYRITSFDHALCGAGVGNYNLVRLSSILPLKSEKKDIIGLPLGSLLPIAYAVQTGTKTDGTISAAIAIGYPKIYDDAHCCVIMEYEGECSAAEAKRIVENMVRDGFEKRGWDLDWIESESVDADCSSGQYDGYTTVFACVAEWEE